MSCYTLLLLATFVSNNDSGFCCWYRNFQVPQTNVMLCVFSVSRAVECLLMVNDFGWTSVYPALNSLNQMGACYVMGLATYGLIEVLHWSTGTTQKKAGLAGKTWKPVLALSATLSLVSLIFVALSFTQEDAAGLDMANAACLMNAGQGIIVAICCFLVAKNDVKIYAAMGAHPIDHGDEIGDEDEDEHKDIVMETEEQEQQRIENLFPEALMRSKYPLIQSVLFMLQTIIFFVMAGAPDVYLGLHMVFQSLYYVFDCAAFCLAIAVFKYHMKRFVHHDEVDIDDLLEGEGSDDFMDEFEDEDYADMKKKKKKKDKKNKKDKKKKKAFLEDEVDSEAPASDFDVQTEEKKKKKKKSAQGDDEQTSKKHKKSGADKKHKKQDKKHKSKSTKKKKSKN